MSEGLHIPVRTASIKTTEVYKNPDFKLPLRLEPPSMAVLGFEPVSKLDTNMEKLSRHHGRSILDARVNARVFMEDRYGNPIGAVDLKGSVSPESVGGAKIVPESGSPFGYIVLGLKDSIWWEQTKRASEYLRSHGLPTEIPITVSKIEEIPKLDGTTTTIDYWKQDQITHWQLAERAGGVTRGEVQKIKEYLQSIDFVIVQRGLQVAERLRDFRDCDNLFELQELLKPIFRWVNVVTKARKSGVVPGTSQPKSFEVEKPEDIKRYFSEWLPSQMGIFLGRLHKLGITHGFPHSQNWSAVGTLYDLDSLKWLPIEEEERKDSDYKTDFVTAWDALGEIFISLPLEQPDTNISNRAREHFLESYLMERFPEIANVLKTHGGKEAKHYILRLTESFNHLFDGSTLDNVIGENFLRTKKI